ncbi:MAG: B12-binding domain-containing radical SAM protein [Bacteroidales bacterium]|nr:MAG: B12-binding domain-containing radical SAM protein [Bacteroidales bacterium]
MKILLINPPRSPQNKILDYAPEEAKKFIHKKLIGPPLGLLTIAAAVCDYDFSLFDMKGEYDLDPNTPNLHELTLRLLKESNPDIVGITIITSEFYAALEIFRTVKEFDPTILTVAGGLHTTLCPGDFTNPVVDIVCPGQAGNKFREIVKTKERGRAYHNVPGIIINTPEGHIQSKGKPGSWDAAKENFLMPDRSLLDRWRSTYKVGKNVDPSTYIFTSLGCPYRCTFCSIWCEFENKFYQRDLESILTELKMIDYSIVRFADANTIVNVKFIEKLFDRIREEGIQKEFIMDIRADTAVDHPKLIEKLAKSGLKVVICGFESFRDEELENYNKKSPAGIIEESIRIFHQNGVKLRGNYVIPGYYVHDDFQALAEYANSHRVSYAGYTILTPMPGTPLYHEMADDIVDHDLSKYNFFNCVTKTNLPADEFHCEVGKLWLIKKGTDVI